MVIRRLDWLRRSISELAHGWGCGREASSFPTKLLALPHKMAATISTAGGPSESHSVLNALTLEVAHYHFHGILLVM